MRPKIKLIFIFIISISAMLILGGCDEIEHENNIQQGNSTTESIMKACEAIANENICGVIYVKEPYFYIEGIVTGKLRKSSLIYLLVAPRTDLESAFNITEYCIPIYEERLDSMGRFSFGPIPAGSYLLHVPAYQFKETQGFPIVNEFNQSNHTLKMIFHGGNSIHSLGAFSITPMERGR